MRSPEGRAEGRAENRARAKRASGGPDLPNLLTEGLFEVLFATEVGLILVGVVALAVAIPMLIVLAGGAAAAHLRRKEGKDGGSRATRAALLLASALALLLAGTFLVSYEAVHTGHPILVASLAAGACAVGAAVGVAIRNRRERAGTAAADDWTDD